MLVRLKNAPKAAGIEPLAGRAQRGANLGRMVGVIVEDLQAGDLATQLQSTMRAAKLGKSRLHPLPRTRRSCERRQ